MNTTRKGTAAELYVAEWLQEFEWTVGSRRHIGGAGDLLATHPTDHVRLIEVKACKSLWSNFTRADRQEMREAKAKLPPGSEIWVVNVVGSGKVKEMNWVPESQWPS